MRKWIAACLSLAIALSGVWVLAEQESSQVVLATVNGEPVYQSEADELIAMLLNYQAIQSETDYATAVDYLVRQKILALKIKEMQFDAFTDEEKAAFEKDAQAEWDKALQDYTNYYLSEDTQEARAKLMEQAQAYFETMGFTKQSVYDNLLLRAGTDRMTEHLLNGYQPAQEEIDQTFQTVGANYRQKYENNVPEYEMMKQYAGDTSWYTPEGYRGVIHILIKVDQALLDEWRNLQGTYEEQQSQQGAEAAEKDGESAPAEGAATQTPETIVTPEMVEAARRKVLDSVKGKIDDIYARLKAGESFESLIAEYGEDPGMQDETLLREGYSVHAASILWDAAFTKGTFADNMVNVGDVSDPVLGTFGVHIIKYLRDVPSGLIMTDAIRDEIIDYLVSMKTNDAYAAAFAEWEPTVTVVRMQEAIDAASQAAARRLQPEEPAADAPAVEAPAAETTGTPAP